MKKYDQHPNRKAISGLLCQYFDTYVPAMGGAETEGGELVRAMMRILYRWENDGDRIMKGYGRVACNYAARSILDKLEWQGIDIKPLNIKRIMDCGYNCFDYNYDLSVYEDAEYLLDVLDTHPELFEMESTGDMFEWRDDDVDNDNSYEEEEDEWEEDETEEDEDYINY